MSIRTEFEKAFEDEFIYSNGTMIKVPINDHIGYALWAAQWMAEKIAVELEPVIDNGVVVLSTGEITSFIRQLAKELSTNSELREGK